MYNSVTDTTGWQFLYVSSNACIRTHDTGVINSEGKTFEYKLTIPLFEHINSGHLQIFGHLKDKRVL